MVLAIGPGRPFAIIFENVFVRSNRPGPVEGETLIWNGHIDHAIWPQNAQHVLDRADRIPRVFEHMVRNHEITTGVRDGLERFAVVHDIDRNLWSLGQFGIGALYCVGWKAV